MVNVPERNACRALDLTNRESSKSSYNVFRMGISFIRKIYDYHIKDDSMQEVTTLHFQIQVLVQKIKFYTNM